MTTASREIEKALFEAAAVIEDKYVRDAFLDQACGGNPAQRDRLENLLATIDDSDRFFHDAEEARTVVAAEACETLTDIAGDRAAADAVLPDAEGPGSWIGRYKIQERIGEGGCGVVYLAEQQEPVRRMVALKVIRLGMDTESVIARFEMERQALAVMDHPNIARVLDAGATETGRPYFVMEWVRGVRITDYCNENRLDVRQRIDLFIQVCHAIQHAHQKGVIHRDIKPSNILITSHNGRPVPKVIDFGIAKATSGKSSGDTLITSHEHFVGTPAYMSPEQADRKGLDVDTRSDVYSLGILLYELLAGRTPFDPKELSSAGVAELRRILMEREPPSPSALLASLDHDTRLEIASTRHTEPAKLIYSVKGDLDWVVMKAIEKDRQRRYETVNGLAMDLKRFIDNEAVMARPPSRIYLFQKFVKRNRLAVSSAAGVAAALVLGLGLAYGSYLRESKARQEQVRLRQIAETARGNEEKLRGNATARENIAQVAVLMSEGNTEEADSQLRNTPLSTIEPSLEAANVLRSLGGWNAMRGRWKQASECYLLLIQANRLTSPDKITSNNDLIAPGPVLAENGNMADFAKFREWVITHFGDTPRDIVGVQVIQATLLLPADPGFLRQLEPIEEVIEKSHTEKKRLKPGNEVTLAAWRAWALSLLEYRRGNFEKAVVWSTMALEYKDPNPYISAIIHPVLAMANLRAGHTDAARVELEKSRELIDFAFTPELAPAYEPLGRGHGFWWDWLLARILFREAESSIQKQS
ncbi:MAG: serine/threonine-protein kinase [Luteolibacter sp.]|uniref:serine/threonine protein kinase n=1 Tax=Luteolibacter sp. TaxID=1962973 RepID=UPI003266FFD9